MHYDRTHERVARCGERVGVVDASSAVFGRVGEDDDMFVGYAAESVVNCRKSRCGQVAVGIECGEMR